MKLTLFQVYKKAIVPHFLENPLNGINVGLVCVFVKDNNIIYINNDKIIKLFDQDLIDITLETGQYIRKSKRNYLVLEVAISSPESRFLFIALFTLI